MTYQLTQAQIINYQASKGRMFSLRLLGNFYPRTVSEFRIMYGVSSKRRGMVLDEFTA